MDATPSYTNVKALIKQFTGQANTLVIPRPFISFTGDHLAALMLSQILYWSDKTTDPDGWFYKTADEWEMELGMSAFQIKRAATVLAQFGVETKLRKIAGAPRMHYRIDLPRFTDLFLQFLENQETRKSSTYKMENQETSKTMVSQETSKTYKEHRLPETTGNAPARESERAPKAPDELALALADACKINPKIATKKQRDALNEAYQSLKSIGATAADVQPRIRYWYAEDWRAKKENRPPRPAELVEIWEQAIASGGALPERKATVYELPVTRRTEMPAEQRRALLARMPKDTAV